MHFIQRSLANKLRCLCNIGFIRAFFPQNAAIDAIFSTVHSSFQINLLLPFSFQEKLFYGSVIILIREF